jgi:pyridoxal phosphate enzyme (YggS family)
VVTPRTASRSLSEALADIRRRIDQAARRAGRDPADVSLMAVTKTVAAERVAEALQAGVSFIGENRVQEAAQKFAAVEALVPGVRWERHLIGHLQTNKARKAAGLFDAVQSVDSDRLAELLNDEARRLGRPLRVLAEVKISDEPTKHGLAPVDLAGFLDRLADKPFLRWEGLMTVAPYFDRPEKARPYFRRLHELFKQHRGHFATPRPILSMGMSQDFDVAVEEGATLVRVGTALFGGRG